MASNSKAMLRHAGEPFFAWGDPLKLRRVYGTMDLRAKKCCPFGRVFQASVCIATYGMSVPSLHTESTDSVISLPTYYLSEQISMTSSLYVK